MIRLKKLLYLELLTYHFNKKMIDDLELPNLNSIYNINSVWQLFFKIRSLETQFNLF